ncbi:MAG: penicillin-binding transpeptidase domain-containing protein [Sandaracinaceae bacterium]
MHKIIQVLGCALALTACAADTPSNTTADATTAPSDDASGIVEAELDRLVEERGATRAAIVILDPRDGRIVAASGRGPDGDEEVHRSLSVGSTLKPLTVAAALDAGLDPTRQFDGEGGEWSIDGAVLHDYRVSETLDATQVVVRSSNIGAAKLVEAVGDDAVADLFAQMGFEEEPDRSWLERGAGIGVRTRLLDLAAAYGSLANGGERITPTADGSGARERVMQPQSADAVLTMLGEAVGDDGTGRRAQVAGHQVGGKTGTHDGAVLFAGVAPLDTPRYVIVVRAEVPGDAYGGSVAAPVFSRVAAALLR